MFRQKKMKLQQRYFCIFLAKQLRTFQRYPFFSPLFSTKIVLWNKKYLANGTKNMLYNRLNRKFTKKYIPLAWVSHLLAKRMKTNSISLNFLPKIQYFQKPKKLTFSRVFLWKRFEQKKKFLNKRKKITTSRKSGIYLNKARLMYRIPYKKNYRKFLSLTTNVRLRYLLQDLIKKYFSIDLHVKISWPLSEFKNLKFYRLLFPKYKQRIKNQKISALKIERKNSHLKKKYVYIGQNTIHLKVSTNNFTIRYSPPIKEKKVSLSLANNKPYANLVLHSWQKKVKKKNKYFISKKKILQSKSEKRLSWASKAHFISQLVTTLTVFVKYLDPQPVVDHIAKIIGTTRKHIATLKLIETVLRTFNLKRGLGYRLALIGRINGANKSRTIYLRKLNRNRSRQTFSKNVNFAIAHARATIGTFAIKLWVYS